MAYAMRLTHMIDSKIHVINSTTTKEKLQTHFLNWDATRQFDNVGLQIVRGSEIITNEVKK